ncbi:ALI_HP2_G0033650.mRNA.1.CDS.1 [Saccharomyces cerevisiae]|nr:ALI_HP2_G0033650.mRNA.1.CDS.1 [Saccharomyces cerevisiae]CAI6557716.1 ALI_HP2_G0033650.mRNA.1.CDS.1 [Saccharomyces cerevisiae]
MIVNNTYTYPYHSNPTTPHVVFGCYNKYAPTSLYTAFTSRSIPCVIFTHNAHHYPHFNIYISFGGPKYCINALNTYVIPLLHHILTTQFIHLCQYYRKSYQKSLNVKIIYLSTLQK